MQLELHPDAIAEAREARLWYADTPFERRPSIGVDPSRGLGLWTAAHASVLLTSEASNNAMILLDEGARRKPGYWRLRQRGESDLTRHRTARREAGTGVLRPSL